MVFSGVVETPVGVAGIAAFIDQPDVGTVDGHPQHVEARSEFADEPGTLMKVIVASLSPSLALAVD